VVADAMASAEPASGTSGAGPAPMAVVAASSSGSAARDRLTSRRRRWAASFGGSDLRLGKEAQNLAHQPLSLIGPENILRVRGAVEDHQLFRVRGSLVLRANLR
jgi:hypothetical protein